MAKHTVEKRESWGSSLGFVLAAAGSAVGLGNIWKFPYVAGQNGGGIFVLIYLFCIVLVGMPIMMAEIMIGRAAQRQPVAAFHAMEGKRTAWAGVGWLGVICGFVILSYYIVVAGWTMDYTLKSIVNFTQPVYKEAAQAALTYRASTPVEEMRETLAAERARRAVSQEVSQIRGVVRPSVRRRFAQYEKAVADAPDAAAASAVLLKDDGIREARDDVLKLEVEVAVAKRKSLIEAKVHYGGIPDAAIRKLAETSKRRALIFEHFQRIFVSMATDGWTCTFWAALFMLICILIVGAGIGGGIERACKILMPMLFGLILLMVVYNMFRPGFSEALAFVFKPDVHALKPSGVLEALGHAFFTLSLGMGAMITYGSYQRKKSGLAGESAAIALLDTGVALLACLMIYPVVFSVGQEPSAGPGLVFMSMPVAFAEIGRGGMLLSVLFFFLVTVAALTSAISLLEVVASYFMDERGWHRRKAAWVLGGVVFGFGIPSAFAMDKLFAMKGWEPSYGINFFDTMDYLASNWLLPVGGMLVAIYAGWFMPKRLRDAELQDASFLTSKGWLWLCRVVAPLLVLLVLAQKGGFLDADELLHSLLH